MAWRDIFAFMCARRPGFAEAVIPVPRDAIATVQRECGVELPATYVELLATLGEDAAGYHPFGTTQSHNFYRLVELIPPRFYPGRDYFQVSRCVLADVEPEEYYLDLTRAAEDDTPLVYLGFAGAFTREHAHDLGYTLAEMLTRTAVIEFELEPKPHHRRVFASADSLPEAHRLRDRVIGLLQRSGMTVLLPAQPRVVGLGDGERAAKVELEDELVMIDLAGRIELSVRRTAEQLLDDLPGARLVDTGRA